MTIWLFFKSTLLTTLFILLEKRPAPQTTNSTSTITHRTKNTNTMVAEMTYHTVSRVIDTWESVRRLPDYEEVAGVLLFRK